MNRYFNMGKGGHSVSIYDIFTVIRAAGRGERMGGITKYYQKCALPMLGKPLLVHWLDAIWEEYNAEAQVCVGHHAAQIEYMIDQWRAFHDGIVWPGIRLVDDLEMGIWIDTLRGMPEPEGRNMLLCYADNFSPRLKNIVKEMGRLSECMGEEYWAVIGLLPNSRCSKATENAVIEYIPRAAVIKKYLTGLACPPENAHSWAGIGIFRPETFKMMYDTPHEVFKKLAKKGKLLGWIIPDEYDYYDISSRYENTVL